MFFLSTLFLFAGEIAAFVLVAEHIGLFWALALLIGTSAIGPFIVRRVGFATLRHIRERLARGEVPTRELLDGVVVFIGGAMICVPGFVSDAFGLLLMVSPVRRLLIALAGQRLARRVQRFRFGGGPVVDISPGRSGNRSPFRGGPGRPLGPGSSPDDRP